MSYTQYPRVTVDTPLGAVECAFTNADHVSVTADAMPYREKTYNVQVHLYASHGWTVDPDPRKSYQASVKSTSAGIYWSDAPRTYRAAIIDTISTAVRAYAEGNPDVLRAAEYADASNDADRLQTEVNEACAALKVLKSELRAAQKRAALNAPMGMAS